MIVREVLDYNESQLPLFDFFNDYDDTYRWLKANNHHHVAVNLHYHYKHWLSKLSSPTKAS